MSWLGTLGPSCWRAKSAATRVSFARTAPLSFNFLGGGGFSIQNANSAEDFNQRLMGSPMGLFYEFDVRALADYGQFMDTVAQAFEKQNR